MRAVEYDRFVALRNAIKEVVLGFYDENEDGDLCRIAVNPATNEVVSIETESDVPDGWVYEEVEDESIGSINDVAEKYVDFR